MLGKYEERKEKRKNLSQVGRHVAASLNRPLLNPARRSRKAPPRSP